MNAEMIIGLVIISIVAGIMIIIGLFQLSKKDNPVGFYNGRSYIPLPFMVIRHRKLEKEYKLK